MGISMEPQSSVAVHTPTYDEYTPVTDVTYDAFTPIPGERKKIVISSPGPFNYPNGTVMNGTAYPSGTHAIMSYGKKNTTSSGPFMDITRANSGADSHLPAVLSVIAFWVATFWALVSVDVHA
ncbi:hypothetical protein EX30DRAFT_208909 [Ascodesmis nigricans]|uniref:Uncharacterized protein n=1 Tax=Ascodesmis nigricans TaxID=341454 RepID=A0A4S2MK00_9PEZI|nr:hypothetical protein EX30DRAFT_208909 [Ascodesmis nigricans]